MSKEEMIEHISQILAKMYFEDVAFFDKFATDFAQKKKIL